jgi:predicted O-methyltransferase YrrM
MDTVLGYVRQAILREGLPFGSVLILHMTYESLSRSLLRRYSWPLLADYSEIAEIQTTDLATALHFTFDGPISIEKSAQTYLGRPDASESLNATQRGPYPRTFDSSPVTADYLRSAVRVFKPQLVVETGVANGVSTRAILSALADNDRGTLVSFDIDPMLQDVVPNDLARRWHFIPLDRNRRRQEFRAAIERLGVIDLFLHDSEHSYAWQTFEYNEAWSRIREGGLLASDDVDASFAFLDFCQRVALRPLILVGERKAFGVLRKRTLQR